METKSNFSRRATILDVRPIDQLPIRPSGAMRPAERVCVVRYKGCACGEFASRGMLPGKRGRRKRGGERGVCWSLLALWILTDRSLYSRDFNRIRQGTSLKLHDGVGLAKGGPAGQGRMLEMAVRKCGSLAGLFGLCN